MSRHMGGRTHGRMHERTHGRTHGRMVSRMYWVVVPSKWTGEHLG